MRLGSLKNSELAQLAQETIASPNSQMVDARNTSVETTVLSAVAVGDQLVPDVLSCIATSVGAAAIAAGLDLTDPATALASRPDINTRTKSSNALVTSAIFPPAAYRRPHSRPAAIPISRASAVQVFRKSSV
jgi:hypothetical protein